MKQGTQNFFTGELQQMQENPNEKALNTMKRPPYYLTVKKQDKKKNNSNSEIPNN